MHYLQKKENLFYVLSVIPFSIFRSSFAMKKIKTRTTELILIFAHSNFDIVLVQNGNARNGIPDTSTGKCAAHRDDYFECLHHRKEHDRVRVINAQDKLNQEKAKLGEDDGHGH